MPIDEAQERRDRAFDDRKLLLALADGDREALAELYRRYSTVVFTLCMRITGDRHDAEEVLSDVFFEIWQKSDRYCPSKASPYTYLMLIARSRAIDRRRGRSRRPDNAILDWASSGEPPSDPKLDPTLPIIADEHRELIADAIGSLRPAQQEALRLAYYDGLTHREVADKLDLPLGTVKGHIRQAIQRLGQQLRALNVDLGQ